MRYVSGMIVGGLTILMTNRFHGGGNYVRYAVEAVDGTRVASSYVNIHDLLARSSLGIDMMALNLYLGAYVANVERDAVINDMCDALRRWIGP